MVRMRTKDFTCSEMLDRVLKLLPHPSAISNVQFLPLLPQMTNPTEVHFAWRGHTFRLTSALGGIVVYEMVGGKQESTGVSALVYHILNPRGKIEW